MLYNTHHARLSSRTWHKTFKQISISEADSSWNPSLPKIPPKNASWIISVLVGICHSMLPLSQLTTGWTHSSLCCVGKSCWESCRGGAQCWKSKGAQLTVGRWAVNRQPCIPTKKSNDMGVSKNNGTPKSSTLIGISIINHPFWGTPIFGNTYIQNPW